MAKEMNVKVLHVCKTTAQWSTESTIISKGLLCVEFTTDGKTLVKIGDGVKNFAQLPYITDGSFSISDYYTSVETDEKITDAIAALGNIIRIMGVKSSVSELPASDNTIGDLYFVGTADDTTDSYTEYVWTAGNKWEYLGKVQTEVDLSDYAKISYVDGLVETINNRLTSLESASHTHDNKSVLDATTASFTTKEKEKLSNIEEGANNYTLPTASATTLGGIKVGTNLSIDSEGVLSATDTTYEEATTSKAGLMSATDKAKLDGLENYDDTKLSNRVSAIEADYIKSTDDLILNCKL